MLKEFKAFALRGNLIELAVAFILGIAFATVVSTFVDGVIMPLIAAILGEPNFDTLTWQVGEGLVLYGAFLTVLVNFLLVALVLYFIVRAVNRMKGTPAEEPKMRACPFCTTSIPMEATRCPACTSEVARA